MSSEAATTPPASAAPRPSLADLLGRDPTVTMLTGLLLIAVIVFSSLAPARFLSGDSLRSIAFQMPELGILALAMMIPLMSGGLNLAIIATANLSALVMAAIMTKMLGPESPAHITAGVIALAFASGLVTSLIVGLITGLIVAFLGVHPILVTLGTMTAVKGIAVFATSGGVIGGFPPAILFLGNGTLLRISGGDDYLYHLRHHRRGDHEPCPLWRVGAHDRIERTRDALLWSSNRMDAGRSLCPLKHPLLGGGNRNDGALQLGARRIRGVLSAHNHSRRGFGRCRSKWRFRKSSRPGALARSSPGDLDRF